MFGRFRESPVIKEREEWGVGTSKVFELDLLVLLLCVASLLHASRQKSAREGWWLCVAGLGIGVVTEQASLRFGGTHCHASGMLNFHECASFNASFYYLPWVYSCVVCGRRLTGDTWIFPFVTGGLFFGMCGVYEMQGPLMGWWLWPKEDGVVKAGCDIWQFGDPGNDDRGLVVTGHAAEALGERVFGFPLLAPFFHHAFGWGIAMACQMTGFRSPCSAILFGPALGMLWDPLVRLFKALLGASKSASAPLIMAVSFVAPLLAGPPLPPRPPQDLLLFSIPLMNQLYFVSNALFRHGKGVIPGDLKLLICSLSLVALLASARAAGLLGPEPDHTQLHRLLYRPKNGSRAAGTDEAGGNGNAQGRLVDQRTWLDRLQKDAQASELDHTNTSAVTFWALCVLQVAVVCLLSSCFPPRFMMAAALGIGSHWLGFLLSLVLGTDKWFDVTEDVALLGMILWSFRSIDGEPNQRQILIYGAALLWCCRLLAFLAFRIVTRGSDWRFDKLIKANAYNCFGWTSGGTWCWINCFCLWAAADAAPTLATPLDWLDGLGFGIFLLGFAVEITADIQKYNFNASHRSGTNPKWIDTGLWRLSRHPNYCGEITLWAGMAIMSWGGARGLAASPHVIYSVAIPLVSPLWSAFFLVFTSLMLLEKRADSKWGKDSKYQTYKKATPVLFPGV